MPDKSTKPFVALHLTRTPGAPRLLAHGAHPPCKEQAEGIAVERAHERNDLCSDRRLKSFAIVPCSAGLRRVGAAATPCRLPLGSVSGL